MIDMPRAQRGKTRRGGDQVTAGERVVAHVSMPGWIAGPLYQRARREHRTISSVVSAALQAHLDLSDPEEDTTLN